MTNIGNLSPIAFAAAMPVMRILLRFPYSTFLTSTGRFYLEETDKKVRIHPRCKCLSSHSLTKELERTFPTTH